MILEQFCLGFSEVILSSSLVVMVESGRILSVLNSVRLSSLDTKIGRFIFCCISLKMGVSLCF